MVPSFPSPLLSLAADAIQDLDGADAITGLLTSPFLFTLSSSFLTLSFLNQSLPNAKSPFKTVHVSKTSLGGFGIAISDPKILYPFPHTPRIF